MSGASYPGMEGACPESSEEAPIVKFVIPKEPAGQIQMYSTMLDKVYTAITKEEIFLQKADAEIAKRMQAGERSAELSQIKAKRNCVRREYLCLLDQARRLEMRIDMLTRGEA